MPAAPLEGKVVVVPVGGDPTAVVRGLAEAGAAIVLVAGDDSGAAGALAGQLQGSRTAVFTAAGATNDVEALVEMIGELFR